MVRKWIDWLWLLYLPLNTAAYGFWKSWRDILKKIFNYIKYLISQILELCGHEESWSLDDAKNGGNFLSAIKLVAQYDTLSEKHHKHAQETKICFLFVTRNSKWIHPLTCSHYKQTIY